MGCECDKMNKIIINEVAGDTQIKVNGEYIATIKGVLKPDTPELEHSNGEISQRYGNKNGFVWVSL